jgi:hypothetical protein
MKEPYPPSTPAALSFNVIMMLLAECWVANGVISGAYEARGAKAILETFPQVAITLLLSTLVLCFGWVVLPARIQSIRTPAAIWILLTLGVLWTASFPLVCGLLLALTR